jgi:hypothetical protein
VLSVETDISDTRWRIDAEANSEAMLVRLWDRVDILDPFALASSSGLHGLESFKFRSALPPP